MSYTNILTEVRGAVGFLTINRPTQLNALNPETLQEIVQGMRELEGNASVRVVVVTGAGDKAFVAGADIKAMQAMGFAEADAFGRLGHECMSTIEECPRPVIAAVNGFALGGGTELALACDFIYAADSAVFSLPEVTLGIFPGWGGTQRLTRIVGKAKANELIFTGRKISAEEALQLGFVNAVVARAELQSAVEVVANAIAANAPLAISYAKRVILRGLDVGLHGGLAFERSTFPACFGTHDCKEGIAAFLERRPAKFQGR
ncbi:MAG: enoyl-CoA hydratase/isomerase family protein [Deltaproteobacteria bacterium]|nr:enoyl-CoA hydratase/isomerase family protein [Deltaproteobacteria bacterium]